MRCGRRYQGYTTSVNTIRRARLVTPKRSIRCHSEPYAGLMEARKDAPRGHEVSSRERGGLPSKEEEQCAAALVVDQGLLRARSGPCEESPEDAGAGASRKSTAPAGKRRPDTPRRKVRVSRDAR